MGWAILVVAIIVVASIIWKVTGHNFKFITSMFNPVPTLSDKIKDELRNKSNNSIDLSGTLIEPDKKTLSYSVKLKSGGTLTVQVDSDTNLLKASKEDRQMIDSLIDILQIYTGDIVPEKAGKK